MRYVESRKVFLMYFRTFALSHFQLSHLLYLPLLLFLLLALQYPADRCAVEAESFTEAIFQVPQLCDIDGLRSLHEEDECRWDVFGLCQVLGSSDFAEWPTVDVLLEPSMELACGDVTCPA